MKGTMNRGCLSPLWHLWHLLWWMVLASKLLGIMINITILSILIILIVIIKIFNISLFLGNSSS